MFEGFRICYVTVAYVSCGGSSPSLKPLSFWGNGGVEDLFRSSGMISDAAHKGPCTMY